MNENDDEYQLGFKEICLGICVWVIFGIVLILFHCKYINNIYNLIL